MVKNKIKNLSSKKNVIIFLLFLFLLSFNIYDFIIGNNVGFRLRYNRLFSKPIDHILERPIYKDYKTEYELLNNTFQGTDYIVFIGDSITARFNVYEYFPQKPVLNRGIFFDTTYGLLNRIETNCNNLNISKCFVLIGFNDLKYRNNDQIIANYNKILKKLNAEQIYVLSLLPVSQKHKGLAKRIIQLNYRIKQLALTFGCTYIDMFSRFIGTDGYIKVDLSTDGVHPNKEGYKIFNAVLKGCLV